MKLGSMLGWGSLIVLAKAQRSKLDRPMAQRVVDFLDRRIAGMENPRRTGKALTGPLGGLWRYRAGDCRVICDIQDDTLRVLVVRVGNRREIYRNARVLS